MRTIKVSYVALGAVGLLAACQMPAAQTSPQFAGQFPAAGALEPQGHAAGFQAAPPAMNMAQSQPMAVSGFAAAPVGMVPGSLPFMPQGAGGVGDGQVSALLSQIMQLEERLERTERALLRLDRRMQLVERNELGRMGGEMSSLPDTPAAQQLSSLSAEQDFGAFRPVSTISGGARSAAPGAAARSVYDQAAGFRPVSQGINSALQAAPVGSQASAPVSAAGSSLHRLPSLADAGHAAAPAGTSELAIWTVRFDSEKVWPERSQLPLSRDIVDILQRNGGAALYARGSEPNAKVFRERVQALGRYLSTVSEVENIPIATLQASHLDPNTIEIVAAP